MSPSRISITSTMSIWSPSGDSRGYSQVSPGTAGQKTATEPASLRGLVGEHLLDELPQVLPAAHDALVGAQQVAWRRWRR
jgi:hypothetical protein